MVWFSNSKKGVKDSIYKNHSSVRRPDVGLTLVGNSKDGLASAFEFGELVSSPRLGLAIVVSQVGDSSLRVVSLLDVSLVSSVDVVVEGVFEGDGVVSVGTLDTHHEGSDHGLV